MIFTLPTPSFMPRPPNTRRAHDTTKILKKIKIENYCIYVNRLFILYFLRTTKNTTRRVFVHYKFIMVYNNTLVYIIHLWNNNILIETRYNVYCLLWLHNLQCLNGCCIQVETIKLFTVHNAVKPLNTGHSQLLQFCPFKKTSIVYFMRNKRFVFQKKVHR